MKICIACSKDHEQPRSPFCIKCQRKIALKKYCDANKAKRRANTDRYRKNNPDKVKTASKLAYCKKMGITLDQVRTKAKSGEGHLNKRGYRVLCIKGHPNAMDSSGWIFEHTVVMSTHLGRPLFKGESIHHKNGIRHDNRVENLELWDRSQPAGQRVEDKIAWAKEFLSQYGYEVKSPSGEERYSPLVDSAPPSGILAD